MKLKLFFAALAMTMNCSGFVVTLQSAFDKAVTDSMGVVIPNGGGFIATGFFGTLADGNLSTSSSTMLSADFMQFGPSGTFGFGGFGGVYQIEADGGLIAPGSTFDTRSVYTVLGNGSTFSGSTDFVIYKHPTLFQTDSADANPKTVVATLGEASGTYLFGGPTGGTVNVGGSAFPAVQMAQAVPEPSTLLLSALGVLALLRRKR